MLILAEKAATRKEIIELLKIEAARWLNTVWIGGSSQSNLVEHLNKWLDRHYFAGFSRKKTVEQVASWIYRRHRHRTFSLRYPSLGA